MKPQKLNKLQSFIIKCNVNTDREKKYKYVNDYSKTSTKQCLKSDTYNSYLYDKNVDYYNKCSHYLKNNSANFSIETKPLPPRKVTNLQAFNIYKNRTANTNNIKQSLSVLYLIKNGYELVTNNNNMIIEPSILIDSKQFESHMAIELVMKLTNSDDNSLIDNCLRELKIKNIDSLSKYIPKLNKEDDDTHYKNLKSDKIEKKNSLPNIHNHSQNRINKFNSQSSINPHTNINPQVNTNNYMSMPPKYSKYNENVNKNININKNIPILANAPILPSAPILPTVPIVTQASYIPAVPTVPVIASAPILQNRNHVSYINN